MKIIYICKYCNNNFDSIASATLHSFRKHPKESQVLHPIQTEEGIIGGYRKEPMVSIVIPTFNRKAVLLENLEHLRPIWNDVEILVIDDYSQDGTDMAIMHFITNNKNPNFRAIRNQSNLGTVKSLNIGIQEASNNHIFILADDNFLQNPKEAIGIIKASDENFMATHLEMARPRGFIAELKFRLYKIPAEYLAGEPYNYNGSRLKTVNWANNAFIFDRRIGILFEEDAYRYNYFRTESEFEKRARDKGIKIHYHPEIAIVDKVHQSGGLRVNDRKKFLLYCIYNHIVFLKRNYPMSKYYKIPFYLFLKTATHPQFTGSIISTIIKANRITKVNITKDTKYNP